MKPEKSIRQKHKEAGFSLPDGYFETTQKTITNTSNQPSKNIITFYISGIAATISIIIAGYFFIKGLNPSQTTDLTQVEIEEIIEEDVALFVDEEDIDLYYDLYTLENITDMP